MTHCGCGNTTSPGEAWCKACWAMWSSWFMRAAGVWIDLETGLRYNGHGNCRCVGCMRQRVEQPHVDRIEQRRIDAFA